MKNQWASDNDERIVDLIKLSRRKIIQILSEINTRRLVTRQILDKWYKETLLIHENIKKRIGENTMAGHVGQTLNGITPYLDIKDAFSTTHITHYNMAA